MRRARTIVGLSLTALGLAVAFRLMPAWVTLTPPSDWSTLTEGFRPSGEMGVLGVTDGATWRVRGLRPDDLVAPIVSTRPGRPTVPVTVTRLRGASAEVAAESQPGPSALLHGDGSWLTFRSPDRFRFHGLRIERRWARSLPPVLIGVAAFLVGLRRRRRPLWVATNWFLVGLFTTLSLSRDTIDEEAGLGAGPVAWLALAALVAACVIEPTLRWRARALVIGALALAAAVVAHTPGLNGPPYWQWEWQRVPAPSLLLSLALGSLPFVVARAVPRTKARPWVRLALMATGTVALATVTLIHQPGGWTRLHRIIEHPNQTSYYLDGIDMARQDVWLGTYTKEMAGRRAHSINKPPGPVLFYATMVDLLGASTVTATICALLIALAAALAVPGVYLLARVLRSSEGEAFEAASLMSLAPSLILIFPVFDQGFPAVTCALLITWTRAVEFPSLARCLTCAAAVFAATFFSYSFLVLGVSAVLIGAPSARDAVRAAGKVTLVVALVYGLLFAMTGFNPVANFLAAVENQSGAARSLRRAYWPAVLNDPLDFALGAGWIAIVLAAAAVAGSLGRRKADAVARMTLLQVLAVNLSGLLRVEAARVWLFLQPLVMVTAGRTFTWFTEVEKNVILAAALLVVAAIAQNMKFN